MFFTLVFHEIRPRSELLTGQRPIEVADGYEDQLPLPLYNSLESFCEQMNYLKDHGYHFLTIQEVKDYYTLAIDIPDKSVLITFDDCYQSQKKYAYPVLKALDIPVVSFVATGWIFQEVSEYRVDVSKTLSFSELSEMSDVFTYANHTHHFHQRKGMKASRSMWESEASFVQDLKLCNEFVASKDIFAYPFGLYNQDNVQTLARLKFTLAFTTISGSNTKETNPLELCRQVVPEGMSLSAFKQLLGEVE